MPRFASPTGGYNPGGVLNTHFLHKLLHPVQLVRSYVPSNHGANTNTAVKWVPCERLPVEGNICGTGTVQIVGNGFRPGTPAQPLDGYEMRINNLPGGCEVHIQMAEVDAAYNVRTVDFKEYIQEKIPGNKLCRNAVAQNGRFNVFDGGHPAGNIHEPVWFFACDTLYADAATAPSCGSSPNADCCVDYPFYPVAAPATHYTAP